MTPTWAAPLPSHRPTERRLKRRAQGATLEKVTRSCNVSRDTIPRLQRLTKNELSDFSRLWQDGCGKAIIEAQDVDRNHSPEV
jgi:hypothetical protein